MLFDFNFPGICEAVIHKVRLTYVTAAILFCLRGEKLGAPWFLTAGFNQILKTLTIYQKPAEKTHKQREYVVGFRVISAYNKIGPCQFQPMSISAHKFFQPGFPQKRLYIIEKKK